MAKQHSSSDFTSATSTLNITKPLSRFDNKPLTAFELHDSLIDAKNYAATDPHAYVGQYIAVKNGDTYDGYIIIDTNGRLAKLSLLDSGNNNNLDKVSFKYDNGSLKITVN